MTVTMFGYLILISIDFYDFISHFLLSFSFDWERYIKHERPCLTLFPKTSKFIKNTPLRVVLSTLFSVFGNVVKHGLSCLICYVTNEKATGPAHFGFVRLKADGIQVVQSTITLIFGFYVGINFDFCFVAFY